MGDDQSLIRGRKCLKCPEAAGYYSSNPKQAVYCRGCYLAMISHKFTYVIGSQRIFRDGQAKDIVVAWSGSVADDYLLHTIKTAVNLRAKGRLDARPQILIILDSPDESRLIADICRLSAKLKELDLPSSWPVHAIHLSDVFLPDESKFVLIDIADAAAGDASTASTAVDPAKLTLCKLLFSKTTCKTYRSELKRLLTHLLACRMSSRLGIDKLATSETSDACAQAAFDALCFGRGNAIARAVAPLDTAFPGVKVIRPISGTSDDDVVLASRLLGLTDSEMSSSGVQVGLKKGGTIQETNGKFIKGLQTGGFPSTISAVTNTSGKVGPRDGEGVRKCPLCLNAARSEQGLCEPCQDVLKAIPGFPDELRRVLESRIVA